MCRVRQEELANGDYDVKDNRRTDHDIEYSLKVVGDTSTPAERQRLSTEPGVNHREASNLLRTHVRMNMARSIGIGLFTKILRTHPRRYCDM